MCLKFKEKAEIPPTLVNLINDDYGVVLELSLVTSNMKNEVSKVQESFTSFLNRYNAKKSHNMFLMLNFRFKSLCFILSYINYDGVTIVQEYDKKCFYTILIKCHNHLHHVLEFEVG
jgi:hypothetical protein